MTGGPDGDLGSNEIKMGREKLVGVVDGSGVLYDPKGINREKLVPLAEKRVPVENYDGPLSEEGYLIKITDEDRVLKNGFKVKSGMDYRNKFHLNPELIADFFVPCGGRPEAINLSNV
jgi:glutamate dehydrogenase